MEIIESREIIGYEQPDLYIIFRINNGVRRNVLSVGDKLYAEHVVDILTSQIRIYGAYAYELNPKYNN